VGWLGKRKRVDELERRCCELVSEQLGRDLATTFAAIDTIFEAIAADADQRLARSQV
jgi:hypothetical protein